jgi:hypothetical protein
MLLRSSVTAPGHGLQLYRGERRNRYLLDSYTGLMRPMRLRDGRFLGVRMGLALYGRKEGDRLKVDKSVFQYQSDAEGQNWIFRYEYARQPIGPYPPCHLHVRGELSENCLASGQLLERIQFPVTRVSLEAVIRLLVDQFHIPAFSRRQELRKLLTQTEREFLEIGHPAVSGRTR